MSDSMHSERRVGDVYNNFLNWMMKDSRKIAIIRQEATNSSWKVILQTLHERQLNTMIRNIHQGYQDK